MAPSIWVLVGPRISYEVWICLWNACANTTGTPFFCAQSGKAPLVTVDAGPPVIVH